MQKKPSKKLTIKGDFRHAAFIIWRSVALLAVIVERAWRFSLWHVKAFQFSYPQHFAASLLLLRPGSDRTAVWRTYPLKKNSFELKKKLSAEKTNIRR